MHLSIHRFFLFISLILLVTVWQASAQCPQRYLDPVFRKVKADLDNIYGGNKQNLDSTRTWLAFDVYEPDGDTAQLRPLVIMIHGGGYTNWPPINRKSPDIVEICKDMAKRGYVAISPSYRLAGRDTDEEDKTFKTSVAAMFDIHEFTCFLKQTVENGNPYRIDTARVFMGGSSAGAFVALNIGIFLSDTAEISPFFRGILNEVAAFDGINPQALLQQKFCGIRPKGIISISGAIIDTNIIKPVPGAILAVHGLKDKVIKFDAFEFSGGGSYAPNIFGPGAFGPKVLEAGIRFELDVYPDGFHVPVILPFGDSLELALQLLLQTGSTNNEPVMGNTKQHMAEFMYDLMGRPVTNCLVTGIRQDVYSGQLNVMPNPNNGSFRLTIPQALRGKLLALNVYDIAGRTVYSSMLNGAEQLRVDISDQPAGTYVVSLNDNGESIRSLYLDKLVLQ